jgi:CheY-like chemotaxis protein
MDCQMAGMDGYTATEKIRRNEKNRGQRPTKIIALTANVLQRDRDRALAVGMDGFLSKPFRGAQLNEILRPIAEARGSLREIPPAMPAAPAEASTAARPTAPARPGAPPPPAPAAQTAAETDLADTVKSMPAWIDDQEEPAEILESSAFWSPASQPGAPAARAPAPAPATAAPAPEPVDTSASSSRLPVLDPEQVDAIRGINKPQLFERMCEMLFESSRESFQRLDAALAAGNHDEIAAAAHALKSPVNNLGGRRLGDLLERCEKAALERADLAVLRRNTAALKAHFAALTAALQSEMKRGQPR